MDPTYEDDEHPLTDMLMGCTIESVGFLAADEEEGTIQGVVLVLSDGRSVMLMADTGNLSWDDTGTIQH